MSNTPRIAQPEGAEFDLTGLAAMAEKSGVDTGASPEADNAAALADAEKLAQEEFEKAAAKPAEGEEPAKTDEEIAEELFAKADAEKAAAEAAAAGGEQTDEEKAAAEAAAAEEAAKKAEEAAKVAEAAAKKTADDAETVHMRPSQKKAWNAMKAEREAAREEAKAAKAEAEAAKARAAELEAAKTQVAIPKEVEEERAALRAQLQELSAERDPEIVKKYDDPIKKNEQAVVDILKKWKFDKSIDDKGVMTDNPDAITSLLKQGITYDTLAKQITALEKNGQHGDAMMLRRLLDKNYDLRDARAAEVQAIKGDVENRIKARQEQGTTQQKQVIDAVVAEANKIYAADIGELAKKHTFMVKPAEPLATDTPAVAAAKKAAIAEFDKVEAKIGETARAVASLGKTGKEFVDAESKKTALAIQSVVLKERVVPTLTARLTKAEARVKELESELGKTRTAGAISRAHGTAAQKTDTKGDGVPAGASLEEGMKAFAAQQGVAVNS